MSQLRTDWCLRRLAVIAGVLAALGAAATTASAALLPAAFGPPLAKFTQDQSRPTHTAVGDFNQDGDLDIVAVSLNGQPNDQLNDIALIQGDGFGNFAAPTGINTPDGLIRTAVGDFNADLDPDLAVSLSASGQVLIFTGAAGMTFNAGPQNPISLSGAVSTSFGLTVGQFNAGTDPDLAVTDNAGNQVEILTGLAGASFSAPVGIPVAAGPIDVASGDFNGDADPDLAVAHLGDDTITILTGAVNATFVESGSFDPGSAGNMWVGLADFNNDADLDLAVSNATSDNVQIFQGANGSTFTPVAVGGSFAVPGAGRGTIGDFNDDADEDLAVPSVDNDEIRILLGDTRSTFAVNHRTRPSGDETNGLSNGLFDGDARLDIVAANPGANSDNVVWHGSRPPEPVIGGTNPPSGTNDNTPEVFGEVTTGSVVDIYKTSDCTGAVAVNNATKAQFAAGVTLPAVPDNSTTPIGAIAVDGTRQSTCSVPINYVEDSDFDDDGLNDEVDSDDDNDGDLDVNDNCDLAPNPNQENADGDSMGDACDTDDDNDGVLDGPDNCDLVVNADQTNTDGDAQGDACDADDDNDGDVDGSDNCPLVANADQTNTDGDAQGDACDADDDNDGLTDAQEAGLGTDPVKADTDDDLTGDATDNCGLVPNGDQANTDGDAQGDACDDDDDGDGVLDASDNCPLTPNADQADLNSNGVGSACDGPELPGGLQPPTGTEPPSGFALLPGRCANAKLGTPAAEALVGTVAGDTLTGLAGNDALSGLAGADCLVGGRGNDRLSGGRGNDRLSGGPGRDGLSGGAGNDRLVGGPGKNRYSGGAGADRINARNRLAEKVNCGRGSDRAKVDAADQTVGCERVSRPV